MTGTQRWADALVLDDAWTRLVDLVVSPDSARVYGVGEFLDYTGSPSNHPLAVAYSVDGDRLWSRTLAGFGTLSSAVLEPATGSLLATGTSSEGGESFRVTAVSFGPTGNLRWRLVLPEDFFDVAGLQLDPTTQEAYVGVKQQVFRDGGYYAHALLARINAVSGRLAVLGRQELPYYAWGGGAFYSLVDIGRGQGYLVTTNVDSNYRSHWITAAFTLPAQQ